MSHDFSPENTHYIHEVIGRGEFDNESAVLNEALRLMKERERRRALLRDEVMEGIDSGPSIPGEQVFARLEQHARRMQQGNRAKE